MDKSTMISIDKHDISAMMTAFGNTMATPVQV
jgi:hypothetical protein